MAKHELQTVTNADPQEITAGDVTHISVQNRSRSMGQDLMLFASVDGVAPAEGAASVILPPGQMFVNEALVDLFPGVSGANRVFAQSEYGKLTALVSHA